jgi:carbamoyl-phosphate synthase small subunit
MSGYQEILTDPSCAGHMVCMTWPLIGNCGINHEDMQSARVHASALLVKECCAVPSNWRSERSLPDFLKDHDVPGIEALDTRALARHLRIHGSMRAIVTTTEASPQELTAMAQCIPALEGQQLVHTVSATQPWILKDHAPCPVSLQAGGAYAWQGTGIAVAVMDYGITWSTVRLLEANGFEPLMLPASFDAAAVRTTGAKALFLSDGPGDPAALLHEISVVRALLHDFPTAGICLGHQLLGQALGASTYKLKCGHHGSNHPVKDLDSGRVEISSQNHGFCLDISKVSAIRPTHINLNDNTLEGFAHTTLPVISVQHHLQASADLAGCQTFLGSFQAMVRACGF